MYVFFLGSLGSLQEDTSCCAPSFLPVLSSSRSQKKANPLPRFNFLIAIWMVSKKFSTKKQLASKYDVLNKQFLKLSAVIIANFSEASEKSCITARCFQVATLTLHGKCLRNLSK